MCLLSLRRFETKAFMKFTYYGHSCFCVGVKGKKILFDPFISPNELAVSVDVSKVEADYIFISHGHEDHIADCVIIAKRTGALVICNWEIYQWLQKQAGAVRAPA